MDSYSALGKWFEYLNADCDYLKWSQYLLNKVRGAGSYATGLDLGCGNGYFTRVFNKAGYAVDGVDISPEMLSRARELSAREGVRCEYLLGDVVSLKTLKKVDFCTAVNDCMNYVPKDRLKRAFTRIYGAINRGGAFFFDVSSPYKLREVIGENTFCLDGDDISYIWFNRQTGDGVKMELTVFIRRTDGLYERREETHLQYAHTEEEILTALKEAGFARAEAESDPFTPKERIQFSAYK